MVNSGDVALVSPLVFSDSSLRALRRVCFSFHKLRDLLFEVWQFSLYNLYGVINRREGAHRPARCSGISVPGPKEEDSSTSRSVRGADRGGRDGAIREIELEQLRLEGNGLAISASTQVRTVTQGWLIGVVLGWLAAFVLGCSFSPVLGFMLVLPFVSAGVIGGLMYAQLGDKIRPLRRGKSTVGVADLGNKKEFLRQLQGRSDPGTICADSDVDSCSPSITRRVAEAAAGALMKSALEVTMAAASSMLGFHRGGGGTGYSWWGGSRALNKTKGK